MVQFKCGNNKEQLERNNNIAIWCSCLGVLGNLVFLIFLSYYTPMTNKIRKLKYAEYTVSSKNFSCEIQFEDDHFEYIHIEKKEEGQPKLDEDNNEIWFDDSKDDKFDKLNTKDENDYVHNDHWTQTLDKPGHWLQIVVSKQL